MLDGGCSAQVKDSAKMHPEPLHGLRPAVVTLDVAGPGEDIGVSGFKRKDNV